MAFWQIPWQVGAIEI